MQHMIVSSAKVRVPEVSVLGKNASRIMAIQGIYSLFWDRTDLGDVDLGEFVDELIAINKEEEWLKDVQDINDKFIFKLIRYCSKHLCKIDSMIQDRLSDTWKFERVATASTAIIRTGISEMLCCPRNPTKVIMSEYISISDMFVDQNDVKFVHAILDSVAQQRTSADER